MTSHAPCAAASKHLAELNRGQTAIVARVVDTTGVDTVAQRLRELGFVPGEAVKLITHGPLGGDPLLVQVGFTRFALRVREAKRILISEPAP